MEKSQITGIGIAVTLLMLGGVGSAECDYNCTTCGTCMTAITAASQGETICLTQDILNYGSTCINNPVNFSFKTFDCQGHMMDGDDVGANYGIYISNKENVTIKNCILRDNVTDSRGINMVAFPDEICRGHTIYNNTVYWHRYGIAAWECSLLNISYNNASWCEDTGIELWYSHDNIINNNTCTYSGVDGLVIAQEGSDNNTISNNIVSHQFKWGQYHPTEDWADGIHVHVNTENNTFVNNTIENNTGTGFRFVSTATTSIANGNRICDNAQIAGSFYDISDDDANSGDNNTCNLTYNWNDTGTTNCTATCDTECTADWMCESGETCNMVSFTCESAVNCTCSNCSECETKLNDASCSEVNLTQDITNHPSTCIDNPANFTNKTFDCLGNTIDGTDNSSAYGIYANGKENDTIQNCVVTDFGRNIYWISGYNITIQDTNITSPASIGISINDCDICKFDAINMSDLPANGKGIYIGGTTDNSNISNSYFVNANTTETRMMQIEQSTNLTIYNNSVIAPYYIAIEILSANSNTTVQENNIPYSAVLHGGVYLCGNTGNIIDNTIWGIDFCSYTSGSNYTVQNNQIRTLELKGGINNTIINNNFSREMYVKTEFANNTITGNNISYNNFSDFTPTECGAAICTQGDNWTFANNTISHNNISNISGYGIVLSNASGNNLSYNTFCSCTPQDIYIADNSINLNSGDNNTCDTTNNWNDTETYGCTTPCTTGICYCDDCDECEVNLNDSTNCADEVRMYGSVSDYSGTCINDPANFSSKVFDCQGYTIDGIDDNIGIWLISKSNNTIKNCVITDFGAAIQLSSLNNNNDTIVNNTLNSNGIGITIASSSIGGNISNNTINNTLYSGVYLSTNANNNILNSNVICNSNLASGAYYDIQNGDGTPASNSTGDDNICSRVHQWNDDNVPTGTTGCRWGCTVDLQETNPVADTHYNNVSGTAPPIATNPKAEEPYTIDTVVWWAENTTGNVTGNNTLVSGENYDDTWWQNATIIDGYYNVSIWMNDTGSNTNSTKIQIIIDNTNPIVNVYNPSENNSSSFDSNFNLNVTFSDTWGLYRTLVNITNSTGSEIYSNLTTHVSPTYSSNSTDLIDISGWADGTYTLNASASDEHTFAVGSVKNLKWIYVNDTAKLTFEEDVPKRELELSFGEFNVTEGEVSELTEQQITDYNFTVFVEKSVDESEYRFGPIFDVPNSEFMFGYWILAKGLELRRDETGHHIWSEDYYIDFPARICGYNGGDFTNCVDVLPNMTYKKYAEIDDEVHLFYEYDLRDKYSVGTRIVILSKSLGGLNKVSKIVTFNITAVGDLNHTNLSYDKLYKDQWTNYSCSWTWTGTSATGNYNVWFSIDGALISGATYNSDANETEEMSYEYYQDVEGVRDVRFTLDYDGDVAESNESNNVCGENVTIGRTQVGGGGGGVAPAPPVEAPLAEVSEEILTREEVNPSEGGFCRRFCDLLPNTEYTITLYYNATGEEKKLKKHTDDNGCMYLCVGGDDAEIIEMLPEGRYCFTIANQTQCFNITEDVTFRFTVLPKKMVYVVSNYSLVVDPSKHNRWFTVSEGTEYGVGFNTVGAEEYFTIKTNPRNNQQFALVLNYTPDDPFFDFTETKYIETLVWDEEEYQMVIVELQYSECPNIVYPILGVPIAFGGMILPPSIANIFFGGECNQCQSTAFWYAEGIAGVILLGLAFVGKFSNQIVRIKQKESYKYEFDFVGNWRKMRWGEFLVVSSIVLFLIVPGMFRFIIWVTTG